MTVAFVGLLAISIATCLAQPSKNGESKITVGRDTTRLLGPLDEDGYLDYVAAINAKLREGVTPENNAAVALWQVVGPGTIPVELREAYEAALGEKLPPEDGDYFVPFDAAPSIRVVQGSGLPPTENPLRADRREQLEQARKHPWTAEQLPAVAAWLDANRKHIDAVVAATRRERYYEPLLRPRAGQPFLVLTASYLPLEGLGSLLAAHSMELLQAGEYNRAAETIQALYRLVHLLDRTPALMTRLRAYRIDAWASQCGQALLQATRLPPVLAETHVSRLVEFGEPSSTFAILDEWERYGALDAVQDLARTAQRAGTMQNVNWNHVLRSVNGFYDGLVAARTEEQAAAVHRQFESLSEKARVAILPRLLNEQVKKNAKLPEIVKHVSEPDDIVTVGVLTAALPDWNRYWNTRARAVARRRLSIITAALVTSRNQHGSVPGVLDELAALVPEGTLNDPFSDGRFRYHSDGDDVVVYSIGANGRDDRGQTFDARIGTDDVVVRLTDFSKPIAPTPQETGPVETEPEASPASNPTERSEPAFSQPPPTSDPPPTTAVSLDARDDDHRGFPTWAWVAMGLTVAVAAAATLWLLFQNRSRA